VVVDATGQISFSDGKPLIAAAGSFVDQLNHTASER
jgi:hypothetical protein